MKIIPLNYVKSLINKKKLTMNDEDQNTRLKKQKYLNSEIIQKGYDPLKFKDFLESRKPGGYIIR